MDDEIMAVHWDQLPNSIRDGVKVAAELSLNFLWVDSICIVQDDPEDVAKELAQMSRIYSQSTITIAATRARSVHDGFLHPRQVNIEPGVSYNLPCLFQLPFRCPGGELGSVYLAPLKKTVFDPLDSRGWAFQERLLSPRILEYNSRQVRWICPHADCQHGRSDGWIPANDHRNKENLLVVNEISIPWITLVRCYTSRHLTVKADRALAIAGVAEALQSHLNGSYFAGLWERSFARDLLWTVSRNDPLAYMRHHGPSWSWLSINKSVEFRIPPANETKVMMDLINCNIKLLSQSVPYGTVSEGILEIRGRLCLRTIPTKYNIPYVELIDLSKHKFPYIMTFCNDASYYEPSKDTDYRSLSLNDKKVTRSLQRYQEIISKGLVLVHLLEVLKWELGTYGLVLGEMEQSDTIAPKRFIRLGVFRIDNQRYDDATLEDKERIRTELSHWFDHHGSEQVIEIV
jgi:hypothetical protein